MSLTQYHQVKRMMRVIKIRFKQVAKDTGLSEITLQRLEEARISSERMKKADKMKPRGKGPFGCQCSSFFVFIALLNRSYHLETVSIL